MFGAADGTGTARVDLVEGHGRELEGAGPNHAGRSESSKPGGERWGEAGPAGGGSKAGVAEGPAARGRRSEASGAERQLSPACGLISV